jgi:hypothetical protein
MISGPRYDRMSVSRVADHNEAAVNPVQLLWVIGTCALIGLPHLILVARLSQASRGQVARPR